MYLSKRQNRAAAIILAASIGAGTVLLTTLVILFSSDSDDLVITGMYQRDAYDSLADELTLTTADCRAEYAAEIAELEMRRKPILRKVKEYLAVCPDGDMHRSLKLLREDTVNYLLEINPHMQPAHFNDQRDGVPMLRIDELLLPLNSA